MTTRRGLTRHATAPWDVERPIRGANGRALSIQQRRLLWYLEWIGSPVPACEAMEVAGYDAAGAADSVLASLTTMEPRLYEDERGWIGLTPPAEDPIWQPEERKTLAEWRREWAREAQS